jgi:hypothetical protein
VTVLESMLIGMVRSLRRVAKNGAAVETQHWSGEGDAADSATRRWELLFTREVSSACKTRRKSKRQRDANLTLRRFLSCSLALASLTLHRTPNRNFSKRSADPFRTEERCEHTPLLEVRLLEAAALAGVCIERELDSGAGKSAVGRLGRCAGCGVD